MKHFVFLIVTSLYCLAASLVVDEHTVRTHTIAHQITVEDSKKTLTKEDILNNTFTNFTTKTRYGYSENIYWTKGNIQNTSAKPLRFILRNLRAGTDRIDVYLYKDKTLIETHFLGDLRSPSNKELLSTKSVFGINIPPDTTYTLITKYQSYGSFDLYWEVLNPNAYSYTNGMENIFYGVFAGIIFALIIYNLSMYFSLKEKMFLFYIAHGFFVWWLSYAIGGVFYFLDTPLELEFITASSWLAPTLMLFFLLLFVKEFLQIDKQTKWLYYPLYFFMTLSLVYGAIFFYGYLNDLYLLSRFSSSYLTISFMICVFIFIASLWGVSRHVSGAWYIVVGEGVYLSALIYITFVLRGEISNMAYTGFVIPLGVTFEMICFSLALASKIKSMKNALESQKLITLQQKQFDQNSTIIASIAHQWKQPLSALATQLMYLNSLKASNNEELIKDEFLSTAPKMQYTINFMSQTISFFHNFYTATYEKSLIRPKEECENLLFIYQYKVVLLKIETSIDCPAELQIQIQKQAFLQILITLLDNSIDEFTQHTHNNPQITICVYKQDSTLWIVFSDNGRGIKLLNQDIFKATTSSKQNGGMGLFIIHTIITQQLGGAIIAKNDNGARFEIQIPLGVV